MSDDTRRHWHGNPGDRHEHLNVWVQGGPKGPSGRAAWAMLPGMETTRRDSNTSTSSATSNANNANNAGGTAASPTLPSVSERRRSSTSSSGALFSNLQTQKRQSTDPDMVSRRASWNEQSQQGGFFSKLWEGYTRGK
ncbi:hypothetical protein NUU61_005461 [Penicillium alfredii]|uniref:Uncharacterized protein n=1 Tax=Penicillium alfredii TaxID=1506179 RepID=A0A9W9K7V1_9EURO|nr:uncharacterized protein NUU61_005461 [Penicillium alfredii]KAJ5096105.1 hypothetical protein NUU61_005461 [Penicillium alfredii]